MELLSSIVNYFDMKLCWMQLARPTVAEGLENLVGKMNESSDGWIDR